MDTIDEKAERERFEVWAGCEYRNDSDYTRHDYFRGVDAWLAAKADAQPTVVSSGLDTEAVIEAIRRGMAKHQFQSRDMAESIAAELAASTEPQVPLSCLDSHEASLKYVEGYEAGKAAASTAPAAAIPADVAAPTFEEWAKNRRMSPERLDSANCWIRIAYDEALASTTQAAASVGVVPDEPVAGWNWMTHPDWNDGGPTPVWIEVNGADKWYRPVDVESLGEFDWSEREAAWKLATAPQATHPASNEPHHLWSHPLHSPRIARPSEATFAHGEPEWVREYPVEVYGPAQGSASDEGEAL